MSHVVALPLGQIVPGDNDRTLFDGLDALAASLAADGLAQPILVRPRADRYEIVAGERRFRAAQQLGWATIPAIVRPLSDEQVSTLMLAENVHRRSLNPMDEAQAYRKRMDRFGWSQAEVARRSSVSARRVAARLALLDLLPEMQHLIAHRQFSPAFGEVMAPLDPNRQILALRWLNAQDAPRLRQFRAECGRLFAEQAQEHLFDIDAYLAQAAQAAAADSAPDRSSPFPAHPDLPPFERRGTLGASMEAYIAELQRQGHAEAALVVGTIYQGMLLTAFCHPPRL